MLSHYSKSMPKMRTVNTPRVKSALHTKDKQKQSLNYNRDKKTQNKSSMNPQKIQNQLSQKLSYGSPIKVGKVDIGNINTQAESPVKYNPLFSNTPKINKVQKQNPKQNNAFRDFQWPVNDKRNFNYDPKQEESSAKISRCMSAQTFRSALSSKSQKSNKIKEKRKQFDQKFGVALDFLMTANSEYLNERLNMCNQKARPKQKIFTVLRPSVNTTNKDFYKKNQDKHKLDIQPQNQKVSILLSQSKVCGNSTSHEFHKGSPEKRPDLAQWPQGFKLKGPIYEATTYSNAYPHNGQFKKMVPIAVWNQHPLGMKHKQTTSNSRHYKGEFRSRSQLATWNNLNPVANDLFNVKKNSMYESFFEKKEKQPIQQWPMSQHKLITTDGKFNTQMRSSMVNFNNHELHIDNKCNCGRNKH